MNFPARMSPAQIDPLPPLGKKIEKEKEKPSTDPVPVPGKPGLYKTPEGRYIYDPSQSKTPPAKLGAVAEVLAVETVIQRPTTKENNGWHEWNTKPTHPGWYRATRINTMVEEGTQRFWNGNVWSLCVRAEWDSRTKDQYARISALVQNLFWKEIK